MSAGHAMGASRHDAAAGGALLGRVVVGGLAYFVAAIVLLHVLRPDVNPMSRVTSEYAVGPYGFIMTSAYIVFSLALLALALGLASSLSPRGAAMAGIALLCLAAAGTATAALFPVDVGAPRPLTTDGWVHRIAAIIAFASMTMGPLLLARPFRRDPGWTDLAWLSGLAGAVGLVGLVAIQLFLLERGLAGAAQRVVLALVITWMLASAGRLIAEGSTAGGR